MYCFHKDRGPRTPFDTSYSLEHLQGMLANKDLYLSSLVSSIDEFRSQFLENVTKAMVRRGIQTDEAEVSVHLFWLGSHFTHMLCPRSFYEYKMKLHMLNSHEDCDGTSKCARCLFKNAGSVLAVRPKSESMETYINGAFPEDDDQRCDATSEFSFSSRNTDVKSLILQLLEFAKESSGKSSYLSRICSRTESAMSVDIHDSTRVMSQLSVQVQDADEKDAEMEEKEKPTDCIPTLDAELNDEDDDISTISFTDSGPADSALGERRVDTETEDFEALENKGEEAVECDALTEESCRANEDASNNTFKSGPSRCGFGNGTITLEERVPHYCEEESTSSASVVEVEKVDEEVYQPILADHTATLVYALFEKINMQEVRVSNVGSRFTFHVVHDFNEDNLMALNRRITKWARSTKHDPRFAINGPVPAHTPVLFYDESDFSYKRASFYQMKDEQLGTATIRLFDSGRKVPEVHISKLRRMLKSDASEPIYAIPCKLPLKANYRTAEAPIRKMFERWKYSCIEYIDSSHLPYIVNLIRKDKGASEISSMLAHRSALLGYADLDAAYIDPEDVINCDPSSLNVSFSVEEDNAHETRSCSYNEAEPYSQYGSNAGNAMPIRVPSILTFDDGVPFFSRNHGRTGKRV